MEILKNHGIKQTKNRKLIYSKLIEMNAPTSAEKLYALLREDNDINLATVYRNLKTFVECGIVEKHIRKDGLNYYNIVKHMHNHYIICEVCKRQFELPNCPIESSFFEEQKNLGFKVTGHNVEIYGICKDCQTDNN